MTGRDESPTPLLARALILVVVLHGGCAVAVEQPSASATAGAGAASTPSADLLPASPSARPTQRATPTPMANVRDGVPSEQGFFVGSWATDPGIPPINMVHEWVLHIETADGEPVTGAAVSVDGDMPAHRHGMPTQPQVTADLGGGDYRVEGMSFQMGGYWIVEVTITAGDLTDVIRFGLDL